MSALLKRLFSYLRLGVEGDDPDPGTGDQTLDELIDTIEPTEPAETAQPEDDEPPAVKAANQRAQEAAERAERAERALRDAQAAAPRPAPQGDPEYEAEEARLAQAKASGATANDLAWIQWQVDQNRRIRKMERNSQQALTAASDLADRTAFEKLEITKPKTFKTYAPRIEKMAEDFRSKGQPVPPRMMLLKYVIGEDVLEGKVKPKTKAPATDAVQRVDRGRLPPARSDVRTSGKSDNSESAKRRARLENQLI